MREKFARALTPLRSAPATSRKNDTLVLGRALLVPEVHVDQYEMVSVPGGRRIGPNSRRAAAASCK